MKQQVGQVRGVLPETLGLTPLAVATEPIFLTPGEVAAILRVHPRTVLRLAQQDATMPATRLGTKLVRFEKAALDRWFSGGSAWFGLHEARTCASLGTSRRICAMT